MCLQNTADLYTHTLTASNYALLFLNAKKCVLPTVFRIAFALVVVVQISHHRCRLGDAVVSHFRRRSLQVVRLRKVQSYNGHTAN